MLDYMLSTFGFDMPYATCWERMQYAYLLGFAGGFVATVFVAEFIKFFSRKKGAMDWKDTLFGIWLGVLISISFALVVGKMLR